MILITGGLGFIGQHTARALLDLGESCVLTQYQVARKPNFSKEEIGSRIFIEQLDVFDLNAFIALGKKYEITGIIHLAVGGGLANNPLAQFEEIRLNAMSLANALQAAYEWKVKRISVASALGVYFDITEIPWREDQPLTFSGGNPLVAFKKINEILSNHIASRVGIECINLRIAAMYGPQYDYTRGGLAGRLVHAALSGTRPSLEGIRGSVYAEDGADMCYVKDGARAIALLQVADKLNHHVYNVASGYPTKNQDIINAIKKVIPETNIELPAGHMPGCLETVPYQDITWLREDTGYEPQFSTEAGVADYIAWLRAGNER